MRSGRIIDGRTALSHSTRLQASPSKFRNMSTRIHRFAAAVCSAALILLAGCGGNGEPDAAKATTTASQQKTSVAPPAASIAGTNLVQVPGGHFTMGDKAEVDAP